MGRPGNRAPRQLTLTLPPEAVEKTGVLPDTLRRLPALGGLRHSHISNRSADPLLQLCWGRWREAPDGVRATASNQVGSRDCHREPSPDHTCFRTPSGPPSRLPHSVEKESPDEIDLCQSRSPGREGRPLPPRGEGGRVSGRMRVSGAIDQTASHSRSLSSTTNERSSRSGAPKRSSPYGKGSASPVLW